MTAVMATTTPAIAALVGCAVIAAIISTADSLINAIASNVSQDFSCLLIKGNPIRSAQLLSGLISSGAILFSFYFDNIVDLLIQSYELSACCVFIPLLFALFYPQGNTLAATLAMIFGALAFVLFCFVTPPIPKEIASILISLLGYASGAVYVALAQKKREVIYE
jgi:SSS family solute:Na+ symporter